MAEEIEGGIESWNVAASNAFDIFKMKLECQELLKICKFGSANFGEQLDINTTVQNKKDALERLIFNLELIITSSHHMINKVSRDVQDKVVEELDKIKTLLINRNGKNLLLRFEYNDINKTNSLTLMEPLYTVTLKEVEKQFRETVKSIKSVLGKMTEEINLDDIKKQIIEGG